MVGVVVARAPFPCLLLAPARLLPAPALLLLAPASMLPSSCPRGDRPRGATVPMQPSLSRPSHLAPTINLKPSPRLHAFFATFASTPTPTTRALHTQTRRLPLSGSDHRPRFLRQFSSLHPREHPTPSPPSAVHGTLAINLQLCRSSPARPSPCTEYSRSTSNYYVCHARAPPHLESRLRDYTAAVLQVPHPLVVTTRLHARKSSCLELATLTRLHRMYSVYMYVLRYHG